jgi:hypothetical protein
MTKLSLARCIRSGVVFSSIAWPQPADEIGKSGSCLLTAFAVYRSLGLVLGGELRAVRFAVTLQNWENGQWFT